MKAMSEHFYLFSRFFLIGTCLEACRTVPLVPFITWWKVFKWIYQNNLFDQITNLVVLVCAYIVYIYIHIYIYMCVCLYTEYMYMYMSMYLYMYLCGWFTLITVLTFNWVKSNVRLQLTDISKTATFCLFSYLFALLSLNGNHRLLTLSIFTFYFWITRLPRRKRRRRGWRRWKINKASPS